MAKVSVEHWNESQNGPFSEKAMATLLSKKGYHVSRYVYPPGTFFPDHTHGIDKIDGVVSGRFRMRCPEGEFILEAGDCLSVPKGTVHSAEVVGSEPVVSLDATRI